MGKALALAVLLGIGCGGDDVPRYANCEDARWTVAEEQADDCGGGYDEPRAMTPSGLMSFCEAAASGSENLLRCVDGSDFVDRLPELCADVPRVCEECAQSWECGWSG